MGQVIYTYIARAYPAKSITTLPLTRPAPKNVKPVRVEALNDRTALKRGWLLLRRANPFLRKEKPRDWVVFLHAVRMLNQFAPDEPRHLLLSALKPAPLQIAE